MGKGLLFVLAAACVCALGAASITRVQVQGDTFVHFEAFDGTEASLTAEGGATTNAGAFFSYVVVPARITEITSDVLFPSVAECATPLPMPSDLPVDYVGSGSGVVDTGVVDLPVVMALDVDAVLAANANADVDANAVVDEDQDTVIDVFDTSDDSSSSSSKEAEETKTIEAEVEEVADKAMVHVGAGMGVQSFTLRRRRSGDAIDTDDSWFSASGIMFRTDRPFNESQVATGCSVAGLTVNLKNLAGGPAMFSVVLVMWTPPSIALDEGSVVSTSGEFLSNFSATVTLKNAYGYLPLDLLLVYNSSSLMYVCYVVAYLVFIVVLFARRSLVRNVHRVMVVALFFGLLAMHFASDLCADWNKDGSPDGRHFLVWQVTLAAKRAVLWGLLLFLAQGFVRERVAKYLPTIRRDSVIYFGACSIVAILMFRMQCSTTHHAGAADALLFLAAFVAIAQFFYFVIFFVISMAKTLRFHQTEGNTHMAHLYRRFRTVLIFFLATFFCIALFTLYAASHPDSYDWRFFHFSSGLMYIIDFELLIAVLYLFAPHERLSAYAEGQQGAALPTTTASKGAKTTKAQPVVFSTVGYVQKVTTPASTKQSTFRY